MESKRLSVLLENLVELRTSGRMTSLDPAYIECLVKYRGVITLMRKFYSAIHANDRKDTPFPSHELRQKLTETGFISKTNR